MKKKALLLVLAALLMLTLLVGCTQTKHYIKPEEFEIFYYPKSTDDSVKFAAGANSLQIIMNTPTAEGGAGNIEIHRLSDDSIFASYDIRTADNIYLKRNTGTNPNSTMVIILEDNLVFEAGESYYVTVGGETVYVDDLKGYAPAVEKGDWVFHIAQYGIDCNINDLPSTYLVGDVIEIPVKVEGEAAQAVLTIYDETIFGASYRSISETGVLKVDAKKEGAGMVAVMYLDKDGKWLDSTLFSFEVK